MTLLLFLSPSVASDDTSHGNLVCWPKMFGCYTSTCIYKILGNSTTEIINWPSGNYTVVPQDTILDPTEVNTSVKSKDCHWEIGTQFKHACHIHLFPLCHILIRCEDPGSWLVPGCNSALDYKPAKKEVFPRSRQKVGLLLSLPWGSLKTG